MIFDGDSMCLNHIAPFGREVRAPELDFRLSEPIFFGFPVFVMEISNFDAESIVANATSLAETHCMFSNAVVKSCIETTGAIFENFELLVWFLCNSR